jgi:RNA polymerase sigma factor (sigma-70 family)
MSMSTSMESLQRLLATGQVNDAELLRQVAARRDPEAMRALIERHGPLVQGVARRVAGEGHADDVFQATFLKLARQAQFIRDPAALPCWLYRTAYRLALDARRSESRRKAAEARRPASTGRDPLDELSARELLAVLDAEIERLPERERQPLILCCLDGQSLEEASARLGISPRAVKGRLERGRQRLRRHLAQRGIAVSAALGIGLVAASRAVAAPLLDATASVCNGQTPLAPPLAALLTAGPHWRLWAAIGIGLLAIGASFALVGKAPAPQSPPPGPRPAPLRDIHGDPLPEGAVARLGTIAYRVPPIKGIGFRPTGELVALIERLNLYVWPKDGSREPTITALPESESPALRVALAPNARFVAGATTKGVFLWDVSGKALTEFLPRELNGPDQLRFSDDAAWLAVAERNTGLSNIHLCKLATKTWAKIPFSAQPLRSLSFSPDGKSLVVVGYHAVEVIDIPTGKVRFNPNIGGETIQSAAVSPDGSMLAVQFGTSIHGPEPATKFFSMATGQEPISFRLPSGSARSISFSSDGKTLLRGDEHGIREWDPVAGKLVREIPGPAEYPPVWSADRHRLATHSSCAVLLVDSTTGRPVCPELIEGGHTDAVWTIIVSPDGKRIATAGVEQDVRVWAADTGRPLCRVHTRGMGNRCVAFLADSKSFITIADDWVTPVVREADSGRELRRFAFPKELVKKVIIRELRLSPDFKILSAFASPVIFSRKEHSIRWDVASGKVLETVEAENPLDEMMLFSGDADARDDRWHVRRGMVSHDLVKGSVAVIPPNETPLGPPTVFSDDVRLVAVARTPRDGNNHDQERTSVVLFDLKALSKVAELPTGAIMRQAFSSDGRLLATAGRKEVVIWDVMTGLAVRRFRDGQNMHKYAIAFHANGRRLITGHEDGTAIIWDIGRRNIAKQLTAADSLAAWADLAQPDGAKGFAAVCRLADDPSRALVFLKDRLRPAAVPPADEVRKLVNDLGSANFQTRENAEKALRAFGDRVEAPLREALKVSTSAEAKRRIEAILAAFASLTPPDGETLRGIRAVWVLERIGTPDARQLLDDLAKGAETARLTRESKTALERLGQ